MVGLCALPLHLKYSLDAGTTSIADSLQRLERKKNLNSRNIQKLVKKTERQGAKNNFECGYNFFYIGKYMYTYFCLDFLLSQNEQKNTSVWGDCPAPGDSLTKGNILLDPHVIRRSRQHKKSYKFRVTSSLNSKLFFFAKKISKGNRYFFAWAQKKLDKRNAKFC